MTILGVATFNMNPNIAQVKRILGKLQHERIGNVEEVVNTPVVWIKATIL